MLLKLHGTCGFRGVQQAWHLLLLCAAWHADTQDSIIASMHAYAHTPLLAQLATEAGSVACQTARSHLQVVGCTHQNDPHLSK